NAAVRSSRRRGDDDVGNARLVGDRHAARLHAVDRDRDLLPPRPPLALSRTEVKPQSPRGHSAVDRLAKARAGDADAVVEVKLSVAVVARIDIEFEWPLRHLHRALHQRLARQDRAGADEYGKLVELRG